MVAISYPTLQPGNYGTAHSATLPLDCTKPGDVNAFNELVIAYQDAVFRQAYWILGDEAAAEDATQEAFLRAYRSRASFNGGPFRPWIMRIATNYCLDQLRRQKYRKTEPLEAFNEYDEEIEAPAWLKDPCGSVEEILERADEQARIIYAIKRLTPEYQAAVILVDIQGFDYFEASTTLQVTLGTLKSRLSRARQQLQKYLSQ